ncbi:MAG: hypothetical protein Q4B06_04100 [Candidatus Saccharibacteria bacterium]|nr:hypothetical protein [Candidatus Saccharibacteria bacterium]
MGIHSGSSEVRKHEVVQRTALESAMRWGNTATSQRPPLRKIPLADTIFGADAEGIALNKPSPKRNVQHFLCLHVKNDADHKPCIVTVVFDPCDIKSAQSCIELSDGAIDGYASCEVNDMVNKLKGIASKTRINR